MKNLIANLNSISLNIKEGGIKIGNVPIKSDSLYKFGVEVFKIISIIILMYLSIKIGNGIINKFIERQKKLKISLDEKKARTVGTVLKSILRYVVYFFGIISIVEIAFGNIGSVFAGLGGVAIGFGAQNLVKDVINGFFILFEDQFSVGDFVYIEGKEGLVENIELRVTKIRDFNGDLHIIPNGIIKIVTNHSRGNMRVLLDFKISYEENIDRAIEIISSTCTEFSKDNINIVEEPKVLGVLSVGDEGITIRIVGKVKSMTQWETEMKLRKEIKKSLDKADIKIGYPKMEIITDKVQIVRKEENNA